MDKQQAARAAFDRAIYNHDGNAVPLDEVSFHAGYQEAFMEYATSKTRKLLLDCTATREQHYTTWQASQAALMPALVEARDAIIEARRNIDAVDNALADAFMWDALARLNTIIGEK